MSTRQKTTKSTKDSAGQSLGAMPYSVLFLDVDGVLNRCGKSSQALETDKCEMLARIVREANPIIVVSSTWRFYDQKMEQLHLLFSRIGANFGGITPYHAGRTEGGIYVAKARGNEIQEWIDENGTPERFVILDDNSDMAHLLPSLIKTQSFTGLTEEITQHVIDALNANCPVGGEAD